MGIVISTETKLSEHELLQRLAGTERIIDNDPFWNKLFSFNWTIDEYKRVNQKEVYDSLGGILEKFLFNTAESGNFATLIQAFLRRMAELEDSVKCENKIFIWQTTNSLIILRYLLTFFLQRMSQNEFVKQFELKRGPDDEDDDIDDDGCNDDDEFETVAQKFLASLIDAVSKLTVSDDTLEVHGELLRILLVLLSPQIRNENVSEDVLFLRYIMAMRSRVNNFMKALFNNIIFHRHRLPTFVKDNPPESIVLSIASSLWTSFSRTISIDDDPPPKPDDLDVVSYPEQTLSLLSCGVLLSLVCYNKYDGRDNGFRTALVKCSNSQQVSSLNNPESSFSVDFSGLYHFFCATVTEPLSMLLFYMLTHRNIEFRNFVLARVNIESIVVPIIRALNDGLLTSHFRSSCRHTYLAMISLLILSEDNFFCKVVHENILYSVDWFYNDKTIPEISLGGLIVLVCVKTVHLNTIKMRDRYLHQNCLATLANMGGNFSNLSTTVCQKIIGLLETMTRRHGKLIQQLRDNVEEDDVGVGYRAEGGGEEGEDASPRDASFDIHQDITALEEGIRTVLETINACLTNRLRHNPHLIYTILYNQDMFQQFHNHPLFQDLVWNIYVVINHFSTVVKNSGVTSVNDILDTIAQAAIQWPTDRLKKFPDLKFKYVEDDNTVEFFVPYVWRLICQHCGIYFPTDGIKLFQLYN